MGWCEPGGAVVAIADGEGPQAGGEGSSAAIAVTGPDLVTSGVKLHGGRIDRVEVGFHWLRLAFDSWRRREVEAWVREWWGEPEPGRGRYGFQQGVRWVTGAEIWWQRPEGRGRVLESGEELDEAFLDLPGGALDLLSAEEQCQAVRELWGLGCIRATKIDGALDWYGEDLTWILDAAERDHRCVVGNPVYKDRIQESRMRRGREVVTSDSVTFGRKGKCGSGRQVQLYDKALEQREKRGTRVRLEVRWSGAMASNLLNLLMTADHWQRLGEAPLLVAADHVQVVRGMLPQLQAAILGAIDFREPPRGKNRSLKRRARLAWWAELISDGVVVRVRGSRRSAATFDSFKRWSGRAWVPTLLRLCASSGRSLSQVVSELDPGRVDLERRSRVVESYLRCRLAG